MLHEMKTLFAHTGKGAQFLILLLLRCPFEAARTIAGAVFLQNALDAAAHNDSGRLKAVCLMFGIASAGLFLYNGTVWSAYAPFVTRMEGRLRGRLFQKISTLSYERIEEVPQGEWITRLNTDVQMPFSRPVHLPHAACAVVNIIVSAAILWSISPEIFGLCLLFVIPHIAIGQLAIARAMPKLNAKSLEAAARNTGDMAAFITCADISAIYGAKEYLMKRFEESSQQMLRSNMKIHARNAFGSAILPLFGMGGYLAVLMAGSTWIAEGSITFGGLTAAFQYRSGILTGTMMLINSMVSIAASMAGIRRVNRTMMEKGEDNDRE